MARGETLNVFRIKNLHFGYCPSEGAVTHDLEGEMLTIGCSETYMNIYIVLLKFVTFYVFSRSETS